MVKIEVPYLSFEKCSPKWGLKDSLVWSRKKILEVLFVFNFHVILLNVYLLYTIYNAHSNLVQQYKFITCK